MGNLNSLILPALLASLGFVFKLVVDLILEIRKKNITQLEERLKFFYWPLLIRIEKDNAIWQMILSRRGDVNSIEYKIAEKIEAEVLENHDEALKIIEENIHLADPDNDLILVIRDYIKHVTVYKAIRQAGDNRGFPLEFQAPYPPNLYSLLTQKAEIYQQRLNGLIGVRNPKQMLGLFKDRPRKSFKENGTQRTQGVTGTVPVEG